MKKLIMLSFLIGVCYSYSQDLKSSKELGLISYLTYIKHNSEKTILTLEENVKEENVKNKMKSEYLKLKLLNDLFINQLSADMVEKNSMAIYRKMNKLLPSITKETLEPDTKVNKYISLVKEINSTFNKLIDSPKNKVNIADVQEVFTLLGINPYNIYKDIKATKEKKIATLIGYIKEQSLTPLTKKKEEKEEEKE